MKKRATVILLCGVLLSMAGRLPAATYEVGAGQTYGTISAAITALWANVGSTTFTETNIINVHAGTYSETVYVTNEFKPAQTNRLVIQANAGDAPLVDGGYSRSYGIVVRNMSNITVKGMAVTRGADDGIYFSNAWYGVIEDCSSYLNRGCGLQFDACRYCTLQRSLLYDNQTPGWGGLLINRGSEGCVVSNCVISTSYACIYNFAIGSLVVRNTICVNGFLKDIHGTTTQNNNLSSDGTATGTGSITNSDPWFVDIGSAPDFHLLTNSVCIGAGIGGVDMGAYPAGPLGSGGHTRTNHLVKPDGSGDYTNIISAFTNTGAQRVMAAETVWVYSGTYTGHVGVTNRGHVTLCAAPGENVTVLGGIDVDDSCGFALRGIRVINSSYGIFITNSSYFLVDSCVCDGNTNYGILLNNSFYGAVSNCVLSNTRGGAGLRMPSGNQNRIINCTLYSNAVMGIWAESASAIAIVKNVIAFSNGTFDIYAPYGTKSYNSSGDATASGTGSMTNTNPLFVNAPGGDFHLKSKCGAWNGTNWVKYAEHSPCIDTGDPADDYTRELQPNGRRVNMGAYGGTWEASKSDVPEMTLLLVR